MSGIKRLYVECLTCKTIFPVESWTKNNGARQEWLKQKILKADTVKYKCPQCKRSSLSKGDLFYYDTDQRFGIWLQHWLDLQPLLFVEHKTVHAKKAQLPAIKTSDRYHLRLVPTFKDFSEKVSIYDDGLDDFAIEIVKEQIVSDSTKKDGLKPSNILFVDLASDLSKTWLRFSIKREKPYSYMLWPFENYEFAKRTLLKYSHPDVISNGWKIVDSDFPARFWTFAYERYTSEKSDLKEDEMREKYRLMVQAARIINPGASALMSYARRVTITENTLHLEYGSKTMLEQAQAMSVDIINAAQKILDYRPNLSLALSISHQHHP